MRATTARVEVSTPLYVEIDGERREVGALTFDLDAAVSPRPVYDGGGPLQPDGLTAN